MVHPTCTCTQYYCWFTYLSGCQQGDGEEEAAEFTAQDIDQILEQRTQQRQIGGYVASSSCSTNVP